MRVENDLYMYVVKQYNVLKSIKKINKQAKKQLVLFVMLLHDLSQFSYSI